jgi:hypothetical protein
LQVWDGDHLVFADIASPKTVANVLVNPHVEINIVNPFSRRGFRFKGRAEVLHSGREFETVAGEPRARNGPTFPVRNVVKVRVDVGRPVLSPAYTCNPAASEDEIRRKWMAFYGVRPAAGGRANSAEKSRSPTSASPRGLLRYSMKPSPAALSATVRFGHSRHRRRKRLFQQERGPSVLFISPPSP